MPSMVPCAGKTETYDDLGASIPYSERKEAMGTNNAKELRGLMKSLAWLWGLLAFCLLAILGLLIGVIVIGTRSRNKVIHDVARDGTQAMLSTSPLAPAGYNSQGTLHTGSGSWLTKRNDFEGGGSDLSAVAVDATVYLIGGLTTDELASNQVLKYDSILDTFSPGPSLPVPSHRGGAVMSNGIIYYSGGRDGEDADQCMYSLDPQNESSGWTVLSCPNERRSDHCVAEIGGKIYIVGGYNTDFSTALDSIEEFDPASNSWRTLDVKLPEGRGDVNCVATEGKLHVVGGFSALMDDSKTLPNFDAPPEEFWTNEHVQIDVEAGTTKMLAPLIHKRGDAALVTLPDGNLLMMGGQTSQGDSSDVASQTVSMYVLESDVWVEKAPMADARFRFAAATVPHHSSDISVMAFGGHHRCVQSDCDQIRTAESFMDVSEPIIFLHRPGSTLKEGAESNVKLTSSPYEADGWKSVGSLHRGSGQWVRKNKMPVSRSDFHALTLGSKIFLVSGLSDEKPVFGVTAYDPVLDVYSSASNGTLAGQPVQRSRYSSAALGSKIYVISGLVKDAATGEDSPAASTLVFDTAETDVTKQWSVEASMTQSRADSCAAIVDGKIYVTGGFDVANEYNTLQSTEIYDLATRTWSAGPDLPEPRGDCMGASLSGKFVVAGGYHHPEWLPTEHKDTVFALDTATNIWETLAPMPSRRGDGQIVSLSNERLLVMGGEIGDAVASRTKIATHEVYEYTASANAWTTKALLPEGRFRFGAAVYNNDVYAFGGHKTCETDDNDSCTTLDSVTAFLDVETTPAYLSVRL